MMHVSLRSLLHLLFASTFTVLVCAETLDFGDFKKFENTVDMPEDVDPAAIWVSQGEDGFTFQLGKDLRAKVASVLKSCDEKYDDDCFQSVSLALDDAYMQQDKTLDSRSLLLVTSGLAEVFVTGYQAIKHGLAAFAVVGAAIGIYQATEEDSKGVYWQETEASHIAHIPEETGITLSASGSALATVTVYPASTALEGQTAPSLVIAKEDNDASGYKKGDLAAILDSDLASRLDEFMHRATACQIGVEFDEKYADRKRQSSGGSYGQALCAAQGVMGGTMHGGNFNDLLHLAPNAHFSFVEAAGPAFEAANQMAAFVIRWAPLMAVPEETAQQIGTYVLALAIDTIVEGSPLGEKNRIKAESVKATPTSDNKPSSTASGCPEKTDTFCGFKDFSHCKMKIQGDGDDKKVVCADTDLKDCECTGPGRGFIREGTPEDEEMQKFLTGLKDEPEEKNGPECEIDVTNFPAQIFSSDTSNLHEHFCNSWSKDREKYTMVVNSAGENLAPEIQLGKRSPPVDSSAYKNWQFHLSYRPYDNDKECQQDCNEAYRQFAISCSASSSGQYMYKTGTYDVGCGKFWYKIEKPEEHEQWCYSTDDYKPPKDVQEDSVWDISQSACEGGKENGPSITKGDQSTFINYVTGIWEPYQFNVWWKDGCEYPESWDWVYVNDPLDKQKGDLSMCAQTLYDNYKDCTGNGGRGGSLQVGCLVYEFKADATKRDDFY